MPQNRIGYLGVFCAYLGHVLHIFATKRVSSRRDGYLGAALGIFAQMRLIVPQRDTDGNDFSCDGDWEQLCCDQVLPESLDDAKEGDVFAMEGRKNLTNDWPGNRVFVGLDEHVWIF